ncbi:MAG: phosphoglycolate phosphatase [Bacteroidetes bacterium]|nr:phosphoglycolate phosphatase [Bacteroidota bacterium]
MTKLIIFDLDGTLLDTIYDLAHSCNYALALHHYPTYPVEAYRFFVGNGMNKLVERVLPDSDRNADKIARVKKDFLAYYPDHATEHTRPYPGITKLLESLQQKGIKLAVASNKINDTTQFLIKHFFPQIHFITVLGQRDDFPIKPNPSIVFEILKETNVLKNETLYVGDSGVDVETALNAGVPLISVLWGFRPKTELEEKGATVFVKNAEDILRLL